MGGSSGFYVLLALIQKLEFLKWSMCGQKITVQLFLEIKMK